jgi:hypothetical protein
MLNKITIVVGLITIISLTQSSIARADSVKDAIRDANRVAGEAERFHNGVMLPAIQRQENYMNQLNIACYRGNLQACRESTRLLRRQNQRLERHLQWQRQRLGR